MSIALLVWRPKPLDRVVIGGFLAGLIAVAAYDAFRLLTVYGFHWWGDFIPRMGGWVTDAPSNAVVGYAWRYPGDGGGIGLVFFALAASFGIASWSHRRIMAIAITFAVVPVWVGLIATVAVARDGATLLFPLNPATVALSLVGHVIYGTVLGACCGAIRTWAFTWPWQLAISRLNEESPQPWCRRVRHRGCAFWSSEL
ncbi:MAG: hypothetical protein ACRDS0_18245 [Pseudonocardiaceae bacterium]